MNDSLSFWVFFAAYFAALITLILVGGWGFAVFLNWWFPLFPPVEKSTPTKKSAVDRWYEAGIVPTPQMVEAELANEPGFAEYIAKQKRDIEESYLEALLKDQNFDRKDVVEYYSGYDMQADNNLSVWVKHAITGWWCVSIFSIHHYGDHPY